MYQYIIFDLDGTLTDSCTGITNSVIYALSKFGITGIEKKDVLKFVGPPLLDSFEKYFSFSEEDGYNAIKYYREYFSQNGIFENEVYEGIPDILSELKKNGRKVILATSKAEKYAVQILDHFNLLQYFDFVAGATMDGSRSKKGDVIRYALESMKINGKKEVIMVGDKEHDIFGAKENNLASIGVLYGYGDRVELEKAGADYIAPTVKDILSYALL